MEGKRISLWLVMKIAFTYVGAIIGAGFASGQEIFQFFVQYGKNGVIGLVLAGFLFILGGVAFLRLAEIIGVESYYQGFYKLLGKRWGFVIDIVYILFITGSISVMLAGSGSIFHQVFGIRYALGVLITLAVVMITVAAGVRGVFLINTLLIPFLIGVILYTSFSNLGGRTVDVLSNLGTQAGVPWFVSGTIYVAFNIFIAMAILMTIGTEVRNRRTLTWGGVLGGVLLMVLLCVLGITLFLFADKVQFADLPMLVVADFSGPTLHLLYMITLWIAMITTAVANVYGFMQRVMPLFNLGYYSCAMVTVIVVLPLTRFGFANLVKYLYPIYGVIALGVLVVMGYKAVKLVTRGQ